MHLDDNRMEQIMGRLLQVGVMSAGALMLIGGGWYLWHHGREAPQYHTFHRRAQEPGDRLLLAGVLAMIATPVLRVAFAVVAFAMERDWLYTAISLAVLALLAYALFA